MTNNLTVRTDKSNYGPGETVRITATGFGVGSTITFAIADDPSDFGDDGDRDFYTLSPNPITDGGVGDLDGNANGEVVTTWFVPTDNNGTGSGTPDALNGTLNLTATGPDGQAATTMFMDGNQALWAWRNQPGPTWNAGTTIQQTNSIYAEGEVIPFRWTIATGNPAPQLQEGVTYTILLDWAYAGGTTSPQKLFFDYLTSYDATEITSPAFGAGSGLSADFLNGYITTKAIPNDTGDTGGTPPNPATVAHPAGNFTLYNIDPNSVNFSPYIADPVNANQEDRRLNITFTPSDNDGTVNEFLDVGVAWGGHLATQKDYGFQNGAASFPGASPQMVVDLNPLVSGDQTNLNINPNAIVPQGQITIIKDAVPNDSQDFGFTITGPTGANITPTFTLDDDSDSTLSNQITFFGLVEGVYTITEDSTSGWSLTGITPTENGVKDTTTSDISSTNVGGRTATITVANGEVWTVKFTNEPANQPSFSIAKDVTSVTGGAGLSADSAGDVINYSIVLTNTGNQSLTGVTVTDNFATGLTRGTDTVGNNDNLLEVGEKWAYTATHTVTQAEIDAGSNIVNTATVDTAQTDPPKTASAFVPVEQNPSLNIVKNATVPGGTADVFGEIINYTISVENTGNQTLTGVTVTDNFATGLTRGTDTVGNNDNLLEVGEKWAYTATHTVTQAEIDAGSNIVNTATVDTAQTDPPKTASAFVPVEQNPAIKVTKSNDGVADTNCDGKENAGDQIVYTYAVKNDGNVSLFNVTANDNQLGNITLTGLTDLDGDSTADDLAVGITATGTATATLTQAQIDGGSITNIALATGTTPGGDPVTDDDTNTVNLTRTGDLKITKTDYLTKVVPGQCVTYTIVVSNCGPDTATHALVEDLFPSNLTDVKWTSKAAKGATDNKARGTDNIEDYVTLPAGSSITYKVTGTVVGGHGSHKVSDCHRTLTNTATVTAPSDFTDTNLENNTATDIDTIMAAPGVRNTHFWQNTKWQKSWDGIQGNEHSQKTRPNFPDSDLLLSPYTNSARPGKVLDPVTRRYGVGLLIGDYNHNGKTDKKENTLFYTRAQALQIVDSSMHPNNRDTRYILGRDLVTSWLNYLAGNSIDTPNSNDQDARDYINEGIHWLQALTPDQNRDGKGDGYLQGLTGNETSNSRTPRILATSSYWKSGISSASNLPNSYKSNTDVLYPIDAGITIHTHLDNYNNNIF
ncbi:MULTISPECIES: DUF11 domain-containing protein [Aphanizomenon]|uniref:DUF11 domain-containing protein n=1 Tax=Aphanizomenon TaxID=1175 RepID=UPI001680A259|nr:MULTISPECIES: DUF11 domain-containing protein [Aphanizomenon]MBD2392370.1 DUF11 domain-containing protein [Aphanizomenon flos-aquae FACHB-1171]MBD2633078.1 DUF11 domain-containing protein [Aphanizomenon sp. FACHB-1399]MBD2643950.1 DUF11 domain-containing protein [Aphanizomenon sp. FACHB-1401]MBD2659077.1 DUF11 domain-containing protein [Aphanizomenon flos-aquae FACHB-1265]MBD2675332.1 DUF11 domain-containing protein [Aphanizomenon flos-aquae FACHB-1416]